MSRLKRKRPHDAAPESPPTQQSTAAPTVTRRATRQTSSTAPLPCQPNPDHRRRRRRRRADPAAPDEQLIIRTEDEDDGEAPVLLNKASLRDRDGRTVVSPEAAPAPAAAAPGRGRDRPVLLQPSNHADPALKPVTKNRTTRHHRRHETRQDDRLPGATNGLVAPMHVEASANLRPRGPAVGPILAGSQPPSRPVQMHPAPPLSSTSTISVMTQAQPLAGKTSDQIAANSSKPFVPATSSSTTQQPLKTTKNKQPTKHHFDQRKSSTAERNIDKVVFGKVCFSTWYHSPYGTEALGEIPGNGVKASINVNVAQHDGAGKDEFLSNPAAKKGKEDKLDRLYVCPCCFKYSKEIVPWWQHVHQCEKRGYIPGDKIYTHPKGRRTRQVPSTTITAVAPKGPGRKKKIPETTTQTVEEVVEDEGEWSIWEVDGEKDGLFCQNLSLFAKLFLDNKSVFFDVIGFKYFLLVYTSPSSQRDDDTETLPPKSQVVGFFSKEKLSWDNNNLACILVFPPWQRKGLGALLMGISYEISRREGLLGGPEKPISDLGKKGYKRFWAGEIAAWILGLDTNGEDEVIIDVEECSQATWIVPEDCLMMLREMDLVEEAGQGPPKPKKREAVPSSDDGDDNEDSAMIDEVAEEERKDVPRVRLSKDALRNWIEANRISLEKACDPNGFVEGYAIKKIGTEDEE